MFLKTFSWGCEAAMDKFSVRTLWLINAGEGAEHREPSHTLVSGNVNWCDHYGKVMEVPQKKIKKRTTI